MNTFDILSDVGGSWAGDTLVRGDVGDAAVASREFGAGDAYTPRKCEAGEALAPLDCGVAAEAPKSLIWVEAGEALRARR